MVVIAGREADSAPDLPAVHRHSPETRVRDALGGCAKPRESIFRFPMVAHLLSPGLPTAGAVVIQWRRVDLEVDLEGTPKEISMKPRTKPRTFCSTTREYDGGGRLAAVRKCRSDGFHYAGLSARGLRLHRGLGLLVAAPRMKRIEVYVEQNVRDRLEAFAISYGMPRGRLTREILMAFVRAENGTHPKPEEGDLKPTPPLLPMARARRTADDKLRDLIDALSKIRPMQRW